MPAIRRGAVFIDRDGTLIEEVGYINHLDRIRYIPGSGQAVRQINDMGLLAIMVTNQSGVANGILDIPLLERVHARVAQHLAESGGRLDGIYYCPHHPEAFLPQFRVDCQCRKPRPGMLHQAARDHGIDLERSYLIGDSVHDMAAAGEAGVTPILVLTGYGRGELEFRVRPRGLEPARVAGDIAEAVAWILRRERDRSQGAFGSAAAR